MADGDPILLGNANGSDSATLVDRSGTSAATALRVYNDNGSGVEGQALLGGAGVTGSSDTGAGVTGRSDSGDGVQGASVSGRGVYGKSDTYISVQGDSQGWLGVGGYTRDGRGVFGGATGSGDGVTGYANTGVGVTGMSQRTSGVAGFTLEGLMGVRGDAPAAVGVWGTGGQVGVVGSGSGLGVGVQATSARDAVAATSSGGRGVAGTTRSPSGTGVHGIATSGGTGQVAVRATSSAGFGVLATSGTGIAGAFLGSVVVIGNFIAVGGVKSAAVPHPDGSHRLTYCVESPESWFEDFGRALLTHGRAEVALDPDFAALIRTDDYHVFLTPEGPTPGLYVADRGEAGFEVREQRGGRGEVAFSYRVVARRRDVDAPRLAEIQLPEIPPEPEPSTPVELPEQTVPKPPEWPPLPWRDG